ncbi:MAG: DUF5309 family protein [Planctomycetota bacterium]
MSFTGKATYGAGADLPELVEDVSDVIGIVSPHEVPLLEHLGDPRHAAQSTAHEWVEDALLPNTDAISDASISSPTTEANFDVIDGAKFRDGDLVRPGDSSEVMLVLAVSGNSLIVSRGYGGTSAISLTDGMSLSILGNATLEGADASDARFTNRSRRRNFTQIFAATVEVSGSMRASRQHGVADEVDYQKQERMRELLRDLENCVINGVAASADEIGSATVRRTMDGIIPSISTNVFIPGVGEIPAGDGGGDELTEEVLNAALRSVWQQSAGHVDTILVGGAQKRKINMFASATRAYLPEDTRYSDLLSVYESDYGVAKVVLSRWVPNDAVLLLDSSRVSVMPLTGRSFHYKELGATGDSFRGQVLGEYTLEFKNENAHGSIRGLAA